MGDARKDEINFVFLDDEGRFREHLKLDNLSDGKNRDDFLDFVKRRKPDVTFVAGFSIRTASLSARLKEVYGAISENSESLWTEEPQNEQALNIPVYYIQDDVARVYQHSDRARREFPQLSPMARYCIGLARYAQSPLTEFAGLGPDLVAITFDDVAQPLVSSIVTLLPQAL